MNDRDHGFAIGYVLGSVNVNPVLVKLKFEMPLAIQRCPTTNALATDDLIHGRL